MNPMSKNQKFPFYSPLQIKKFLPFHPSYLYQLEPMGLKSSQVESLTSFIARLAESHCVPTGIMMTRVIAPLIDKDYITKGAKKGLSELLDRGSTLNSFGRMSRELIHSLEKLVARNDLHLLTLQAFGGIFPSQGLLRNHKAWCPICYQEWRSLRQTIYEPLLWTIESVKVCPYHHQPLQMLCLSCHRQIPWLAWNSRIGYCSHCHHWLGSFEGQVTSESHLADLEWLIWASHTVGELIAQIPDFSISLPTTTVAQSIQIVVNITHKGNIAAFARSLRLPKNTVWMWHQGKATPRLDVLLKICRGLGISLIDFLTLKDQSVESLNLHLQKLPSHTSQSRKPRQVFDFYQVHSALQAILLSDEQPPPNLQQVADRLGHDRRVIFQHFPDLCQSISARYRYHVSSIRAKAVDDCCQQVKAIVVQLYQDGEFPSEARVSSLLPKPGYFRYQQVRSAFKQIRQELSLID